MRGGDDVDHGDGVEAGVGPGRVPSHVEKEESQEREEEEREEERTQQDVSSSLSDLAGAGGWRLAVGCLVAPLVSGLAPADVDQGRAGQAQPALH